jgi:hypothetical protein
MFQKFLNFQNGTILRMVEIVLKFQEFIQNSWDIGTLKFATLKMKIAKLLK